MKPLPTFTRRQIALTMLTLAVGLVFAAPSLAEDASIQTWPVNIHEKVFSDTPAGQAGTLELRAARNEYESGQFGIHVTNETTLTLSVTDLTHEDGLSGIPAANVRLRPIGTVPITRNSEGAESIISRKAPCDFPDVLYENAELKIPANESRSVWVTVFVPEDAKSGNYSATIKLSCDGATAEIPLRLEVFKFTLPSERHLYTTNWYSGGNIAKYGNVSLWSDEYWPVLEKYFQNMQEHRQNVILAQWVPNNGFVYATRKKDGTWEVDFSNLERLLTLAEKYGLTERIEFSHCGGIDRSQHVVRLHQAWVFDEAQDKVVALPGDEWLAPVLRELEKWLIQTNRIDRAMIHIADEPYLPDMPSWREVSRKVHEAAPRIKRIDAIESVFFFDDLEVWVPKLSHLERWQKTYLKQNPQELWYYICCHPVGSRYPNRFMDIPATRVRSLHWINYLENLKGYLHWGYNFWAGDPFGVPNVAYGPGDTHVSYPGPLDSIRWEIERESLEDYEYFVLLENLITQKVKTLPEDTARCWNPKQRSMEIGRRAVHSMTDIELEPQKFEDARLEVARTIEELSSDLWLLVESFPEDNSLLTVGPVIVEYIGLTVPGAKVVANGIEIPVQPDGSFVYHNQTGKEHTIEFVSIANGKYVKTARHFRAQ